MTNEEILRDNTSDEVTKTIDEIQNIIGGGEGVSRANDLLRKLDRVRRGYLDQKNRLSDYKFASSKKG